MYFLKKDINREFLIRESDGASIPFDDNNSDYRDYLAWIELGNRPIIFEETIDGFKNYLYKYLNEKYLESQNITFSGDIDVNIQLTGDKFTYFQNIIDRAKSEDPKYIQEYQFEDNKGNFFYIKLSNFFWVKIFGEIQKYSSVNRRLKLSIQSMIDNSKIKEDLVKIEESIKLFPEKIVLNIDFLIQSFNKDSTIPDEFLKKLSEIKDNFFKKVSIESSLEDINALRKKYGL